MKKEFKEVLSLASNVLLYVISLVLLLSLYLEINIIFVICIAMSFLAILIHFLSLDDIKVWYKSINIFYFLILLVLSFGKLLYNDLIFNLGLALFVILILAYIFFSFIKKQKEVIVTDDNENINKNVKNKNKKGKKKKNAKKK